LTLESYELVLVQPQKGIRHATRPFTFRIRKLECLSPDSSRDLPTNAVWAFHCKKVDTQVDLEADPAASMNNLGGGRLVGPRTSDEIDGKLDSGRPS